MAVAGLNKYYKVPLIQKLSTKTKQKPSMIVFGIIIAILFLSLTPIGSFLTTFLAFTIPAF